MLIQVMNVKNISFMSRLGNDGNYPSGVISEVFLVIKFTGILHLRHVLIRSKENLKIKNKTKYRFSDAITKEKIKMNNLLTRESYLTKCMMQETLEGFHVTTGYCDLRYL